MDFFIIYFVLFISIFIHELGHYLTSKMFNVPVYHFSIGVGPKIFSFFRYGTKFEVRLLPLGGYIYNDELKYESLNLFKTYVICLSGIALNFFIFILALFTLVNFDLLLFHHHLTTIYYIITQGLRNLNLKSIYIIESNFNNLFAIMRGETLWFLLIITNLTLALTNLIPLSSLDGNKVWMATVERFARKLPHNKINIKTTILLINILVIIFIFLWFVAK